MERQRALQALVERQGNLTVEEACRLVGISAATVRRDFVSMSSRGSVIKTWGGVRKLDESSSVSDMLPSGLRETLRPKEKERIARKACELIKDGDVIVIDGGTTTLRMAPFLANRRVRIVTNSILIAHRIDILRSVQDGAEVILTGGLLYPSSGLLVGPEAVQSLGVYNARWAFLSVGGLDTEGATNTNQWVVESERKMFSMAESVVVLADATKWGRKELVQSFQWKEIAYLVTDSEIPAEFVNVLDETEVIVA